MNVYYVVVAPSNASLNHYRINQHNGAPIHRNRCFDTLADAAHDDSAGLDTGQIASAHDHHSLAQIDRAMPYDSYYYSCPGYFVEVEEVVVCSVSRSVWLLPNEIVNVVEHVVVPINLSNKNANEFMHNFLIIIKLLPF